MDDRGAGGDRTHAVLYEHEGEWRPLTAHEALAAVLDMPLDMRRFRTNVHLELDAPAWEEQGWEGGTVRFAGGVVLRLLDPCVRSAITAHDPRTQASGPSCCAISTPATARCSASTRAYCKPVASPQTQRSRSALQILAPRADKNATEATWRI
jgi:uncharacterized protein YcbX